MDIDRRRFLAGLATVPLIGFVPNREPSKTDLIKKMRAAHSKMKFISPIKMPEYASYLLIHGSHASNTCDIIDYGDRFSCVIGGHEATITEIDGWLCGNVCGHGCVWFRRSAPDDGYSAILLKSLTFVDPPSHTRFSMKE